MGDFLDFTLKMSEPGVSTSTRVGGLIDAPSSSQESNGAIPAALKAKIERSRQRALLLKQAKLIPHPCAKMYANP